MANLDQPIVKMSSITKRFLDVTANEEISFQLHRGEICALLGENGAGKTTLMNILFGYYTSDEGDIFIKGEKADLSAPRDAIARGVGMIHQHFALVPSQTVLENIIVGTGKGIFLDLKSARRRSSNSRKDSAFRLIRRPECGPCRWVNSRRWRSSKPCIEKLSHPDHGRTDCRAGSG